MITNIIKISSTIPKGIQIGESTHHQDQSILPVNFSIINTINNIVGMIELFDSSFFTLI